MGLASRNPLSWRLFPALLALGILAASRVAPVLAQEYYDQYRLTPDSPPVDIGAQPLGVPSGVISAVMSRDKILRASLAESGLALNTHPFRRGADLLPLLADRRLEGGLLGDMPTIIATALGEAQIVGLVKQTSTSIVARGLTHVNELAGKRIGYVDTSSAHHTLLQGLASAGLGADQVKLVPLAIDAMAEALESNDIDAFSGWEPAPSQALARSSANRVVFRGLSADYFVLSAEFTRRSPDAALEVVAGLVRAIEWMRRSRDNLSKAGKWALVDSQAFSGKPAALSVEQVAMITRRDILDVPAAPAIAGAATSPPLKGEFEFLQRLGKLPTGAQWTHVETAFRYDGLRKVISNPRKYQLNVFNYDD